MLSSLAQGQSYDFKGMVADQNHEPLIGATIVVVGTSSGTTTDINGQFGFKYHSNPVKVVVSYVGYVADTLAISSGEMKHIMLREGNELEEVVVKASPTFIDNLQPLHIETLTEAELLKAPCCNLSESFETNASVDVSFTDAITGTRQISMLGLSG